LEDALLACHGRELLDHLRSEVRIVSLFPLQITRSAAYDVVQARRLKNHEHMTMVRKWNLSLELRVLQHTDLPLLRGRNLTSLRASFRRELHQTAMPNEP
jgi:hypothetical protein